MATAMLFALPGEVSAGSTAQTITAPDIADKTYGDAAFSVAATSDSSLTVSYAAQGPARVTTAGELTITGAGTVKVFFFQNGDATYAAATPVVETFTVAKKTVDVTVADSTVTYDGTTQPVSASATGGGSALTVGVTYAGSATVPSAAGSYAVVATVNDSNYQGTDNATLTINAAALTATLGTKTISYGADAPAAADWVSSLTYSGLAASDDSSAVTTTNLAVAHNAVGNVGDYAVTPSGLSASNYSISYVNGTLTVEKAAATVTLASLAQDYTSNVLAATATTDPAGLTVDLTYSTANPTNAGSYTVTGTINDTNYSGTATGTLVISKASATVTLGSLTQTYTGATLAATATSNPAGLTVDLTYDADPANAGTYAVTGTVNDTNYSGTASGTLTINQAALTATLGTKTITYGGTEPTVAEWAASLTYSDFLGSDTSSVVVTSGLGVTYNADVGNVANYTATPAGLTASNYTITHATGTLVVNKADTTVSLDALADLSYTATPISLAAASEDGRTITYFVTGAATAVGNEVTLTSAGDITVVAFVQGTDNYNGAYETDTFTVSKAAANVAMSDVLVDYDGTAKSTTASATDSSGNALDVTIGIVYTDSSNAEVASPTNAGTYTATATISDSRYSGSQTATLTINKDTAVVTIAATSHAHDGNAKSVTTSAVDSSGDAITVTINTTYAGSSTAPSAAGDYAVVSTISNDNYEGTKSATLTIGKVALDVTAVTYNGAEQVPTLTLTPSDLSHTITYDGGSDNPKNAADYAVVVTVNDSRYSETVNGTFTINPATITVTAADASRGYGDENPDFSVSYSGFMASETASDLTTQATPSSAAAATSAVGTYDIEASGAAGGNYAFVYVDGTLTVSRAALTVTPDDKSKTYLDDNPPLTVSYSGFKNSENNTALSIQPTIATAAVAGSSVGTYDITVSGADSPNYTIDQSAKGTLTVEKKDATVTIASTSQTYTGSGLEVSTTPSVSGLQVDVSYTLDGAAVVSPTNAGSYAVSAVINDSNYSGTASGTLTIDKADASVTLGSLTPTYTGSVLGASATTAPAGLTVDFTYSTADPTNAGTYTVTGTVNDANYKGSASSDAFVIGKAALTAVADDLTKVYGEANPSATITYSGFLGSDSASDLDTAPAATTNADATSGVGEYDISLAAGSDNNYTITNTDGKLTVTKKGLIATAETLSKVYGTAVPAISVAYGGFVNGDDVAAIDTAPTTTTLATATSPVVTGGYATSAVGGADDNYSFTYVNGTLTVTQAAATLTITGTSQQYTGEPVPVTVTTNPSGLESGVVVTYDASSTVPSALGTYAVEANLVDQNYTGTASGSLTIAKGDQSVTFTHSGDVIYGVAPIDMGAKSSSGADVLLFVSGPAYVTGDGKIAVTDVGKVSVLGYEIGSGSWSDGISATSFNVKKPTLTVTASDATKTYGDANPSLTYTITGFADGEDASVLSTQPAVTTSADGASNVGAYSVTFSTQAVDGSGHYEITHVDGTLTVGAAPLTVTAVDQSRTYGDENPDAPVISGLRVREYHGIGGGKVTDLTGNAKYPDGFDFQAVADYFEWPQSGDISKKPGNKADNYGIELAGYITPTESGEYQFHISSDDASELWLSTDESPGNLVKIATESNWNGVRNYPTSDRRSKVDVYELTVTGTANDSAANDAAAAALATATTADTDAKAAAAAATTARDETAAALVAANEKASAVDATQAEKDAAATAATAATAAADALATAKAAVDSANQAVLDAKVADANALLVVVEKTKALSDAKAGGDADAITAATAEYTTATSDWATTSAAVVTAQAALATANADVTAKETALTDANAASDAAAAAAAVVAATADDIAAAATAQTAADTAAANLATALQAQIDAATALATAQATYDATVAGTAAVVAAQVAADINAKTGNSNAVTATAAGGVITITANEANTPITITASAANGGQDDSQKVVAETTTASAEGVAQVATVTISGRIETGDSLKLNITGGRNENVSEFISLVAGQSYYVKALMKEGGGGDNFAVAWIKKGEAAPAADALPIPGDVLTPASSITYTYAGLKLDQSASDLTVLPTGTIDVSPTSNVGDYDIVIGGAQSSNYDITYVNGKLTVGAATLTVTAANKEVFESLALPGLTYSYSGFLNGQDDSIITTHSSISTDADNSVPGDYAIVVSGTVAPNYSINNVNGNMKIKTVGKSKVTGLSVSKANAFEGDSVTFTATATGDLLTYEWFVGTDKVEGVTGNTLTLSDVSLEQAGRVQVFASNFKGKSRKLSKLSVSERLNQVFLVVGNDSVPVQGANSIKIREYHDIGGTAVSNLTGNAKYPDSPDAVKTASKFESETNVRDNYGIEASGYLHPKETGDYTFYLAADDGAEVWLSTDDDAANGVKIAQETSWRGVRNYDQDGADDGGEAKSAKIALEGGKVYHIKVLMKEGGGGDNMALAWSFNDNAAPADGAEPIGGDFLSQNGSNNNHPDYVKDVELKKLLESQGYSVIMQGAGYPENDIDPRHAAFVVVSSTVTDSALAAKYKNTTAPIINLSGVSQDDLGYVGNEILTGSVASGTSINIADASHALAGGLAAGAQEIASAGQTINWGMPNANANVIATIGDSEKAAIYAYEVGVGMGGGIAAAGRRVNLHTTTDGLATATAAGSALISAAVNWVMEFDILGSGGDLDMVVGESLVLDGRAIGENIVVQWYKDGVAIEGGASLDLGVLEQGDAGTYTRKATDPDAPWVNRFKEVSYVVSVSERGPEAVLVTSSSDLTASDAIIKSKLENKGYYVIQSDAADTYATDVEGKMLVVISPSAAASGEIVFDNTGSTSGAFFATTNEFGDQMNLGLNNRLIDSLSFEYYGDFTADGDETAVARIYANDGAKVGAANTPGTLLYESDSFSIAAGFNSVNISGLLVEGTDTITWTVEFDGVGEVEGNRAGLIFYNPPAVGSSADDFWVKSGGSWSTFTAADAETVNNFGARVTAGIEDDLLTSANVPMVVLSSGLQSSVKYTGAGESDSGTASGSKITIVNADHGLAGGLTGDVGLVILGKGDAGIGWGVPQGDAAIVATLVGDGEKAAIYGYEEGALLGDGNGAPERRSFVFATDELLGKADANALKLIDSAIDWTGGTGFTSSPSNAELLVGENVTLSAAGYGPGDVTYQWKKNGGNIDGATAASLTLETVAKGDAANYSVVATSASGATAEVSASVKVYSLPTISMKAPAEGSTTAAVTHQVQIRAIGGADRLDAETISVVINGVDVTENAKVMSNIRGIQLSVDLVENANTDTIQGVFLGYEDLAPGANNAMQVTMSYEVVGGDRVLTNQWSYTLYDSTQAGDGDIAKMAVNQIFQRGSELYVVWPGSPGLMLERNSDCKGGVWEPLTNTVGKGLHVEQNCGTQAFFRLVRVKE